MKSHLALLILISHSSQASGVIPYTNRTSFFSAYSTTLRGDLSNLSLAGASAALGDQFIGSIENPAGPAMTARSGGIQISSNQLQDGFVQNYSDQLTAYHYGLNLSEYPWGISAGVWSPQRESSKLSLTPGGTEHSFETANSEYRFSLSRVLPNHKFSIGAALVVGDSTQSVDDQSRSSMAIGYSLGVIYQFQPHQLLGASFTSPLTFNGNLDEASPVVSNFYHGSHAPLRIQMGYGWIPNRLFRFALGLTTLGTSPNTSLLLDEKTKIGTAITFHPRIGCEMTIMDYKEFWLRLGTGSYLEASRIQNRSDRMHWTGSIDATGWIFSFGWGIDTAMQYRNYIYSGGIDIVKLLQKLDLVPPPTKYPSQGFLPNPLTPSDEGLSRPLTKDWIEPPKSKTVFEIGRELPSKVQNKFLDFSNKILGTEKNEPVKKKTKKKKKKKIKVNQSIN